MAFGIAGDVDTADIVTDVSLQVKMRGTYEFGQSIASSRDMVGQNSQQWDCGLVGPI